MGFTLDARGKPIYDDQNDPRADLQGAADWADRAGGLLQGTKAEREGLTSAQSSIGWLFSETDTGFVYIRTNTGWRFLAAPDTQVTQSGILTLTTAGTSPTTINVDLPVPFADTDYTALAGPYIGTSGQLVNFMKLSSSTVDQITFRIVSTASISGVSIPISWQATGRVA